MDNPRENRGNGLRKILESSNLYLDSSLLKRECFQNSDYLQGDLTGIVKRKIKN